jgi:hypothetical protein
MTSMSTALLDRPVPPGTPDSGGVPFRHLWCCVPEVALCGTDLSGAEEADDEDEPVCTLCSIADAEGMRCPVEGCKGGAGSA